MFNLFKKSQFPKDGPALKCPNCKNKQKVEGTMSIENPTIYFYNENKPKINDDGLKIYSMICFECSFVSGWATDEFNESGNAIEGIEYFDPREATSEDYTEAIIEATMIGCEHIPKKLIENMGRSKK